MQSSVDFQMPYRLLMYIIEIWRGILKDIPTNETDRKEFKLPVIVPKIIFG